MKVLVTGARGFLGRSIVQRLLSEGAVVRALVRPGQSADISGAEIVEGDISDDASVNAAVRGVDAVVHAAARVQTTGPWEAFAEANVRGTSRVIRAAQAAQVGRVIYISSLSVYAVPNDGVTITEDSPYESESDARGHYSRSKLAADRLALFEARRGAPIVVLRPGLLYGPGRRPPAARQSFDVRGFKLVLARPAYLLPLTHVDSVAAAVHLALRCEAALGKAFTIVDENVRQSAHLESYRRASGERWRPLFLPVGLVAGAALVLERTLRIARRRSPVTYHQVSRATRSAWYDCARAERVLGWRPAISVPEGVERAFRSLRSEPGALGAAAMVGSAT